MKTGIDSHGNRWQWNCGWRIVGHSMSPLPHSTFRQSITIVGWSDLGHTYQNRNRPYGTWRRADERLYDHFLYGEVTLLETDGIHAIVKCRDNLRHEVSAASLTLSKSLVTSRPSTAKSSKWGDLKPYIKMAQQKCHEVGVQSPTDKQLRTIAEKIKTAAETLFIK